VRNSIVQEWQNKTKEFERVKYFQTPLELINTT